MVSLSINIVHTPGYNELDLMSNTLLQNQLRFLADHGVIINILVNGQSSQALKSLVIFSEQPNVKIFEFMEYRLYLGVARNYLTQRTTTDWYIQADEDDWFLDTANIIKLQKVLDNVDTPIAFYRSECYDSQDNLIRTIPREKDGEVPNRFRFFYQYAIDNSAAYNTRKTSFLSRPAMNNGVDEIFSFLCSIYFPKATFIPIPIYHYNQGDAKMSNEGSKSKIHDNAFYYLDKYMDFEIVKVITEE